MRPLYFLPGIVSILIGVLFTAQLLKQDQVYAKVGGLMDKEIQDFSLNILGSSEKQFTKNDLIGQVTIVNVFASWCGYCKAEHPTIVSMAKNSPVPVIGILYKDGERAALEWLEKHGNPYKMVADDPSGDIAKKWGITGLPDTFIIDAKGHIRYRHGGPIMGDDYNNVILPHLNKIK